MNSLHVFCMSFEEKRRLLFLGLSSVFWLNFQIRDLSLVEKHRGMLDKTNRASPFFLER